MEQLQATPDLHRIVYRDIRQARVARFPYLVFYRAKAERVEVIAILHSRRSTAAWKGRL
ncbi:type II toxin-antitoxin system RelE/ParE family toxin [Paludisphaera soli]|uniref:type II toxin-antitoxin system RelE/ParE family toxin n=1 Tax=Paludisphaera soli TaxID=2712865 RepID=UPI0013EE3E97